MSQVPATIPKQPMLKPAEDYYRLRREGIGFIEEMGSRLWTDYNAYSPGITILESLCYVITDLAYRTGWDIRDILAPAGPSTDPSPPFPNQSFFTARNILTVNPWTPNDFRRLLIDLDMVRNAWVFCKSCACDLYYYAWCQEGELILSYQKPVQPLLEPKRVEPPGLYEVLLELESDPELGDLNDRKIEQDFQVIDTDGKPHPLKMELRFPQWELENRQDWNLFLQKGDSFTTQVSRFGATKTYNILTELDEAGRNKYVRDHWSTVFYVDFEITLVPGGETITIKNTALRLFSDSLAKSKTSFGGEGGLKAGLEDKTGFIERYRSKLLKVEEAVTEAGKTLHRHRNLDEDYCRLRAVDVEDVAVCADVETAPDADIERVQARIWFEIEQYFNPPVPFYSLQELMAAGVAVEDIFNGPELKNGFIKTAELEAAGLKTVLRTSDIVNRLMDIEGVVAVNNLLLTQYDSEGNVLRGTADPTWNNGKPAFDPDKISAAWLLFITPLHQPRLYLNQSRFLFFKNGLPFLPRLDEAHDTLTQLRGEMERPKIKGGLNDLPVPAGTFRHPEEYFPVQYSFPQTYGIGPEGLPSQASAQRRAQARQLKAYLLVFEQILANAHAQLAHTADLFSLDPTIQRTYFVREFSEATLQGYTDIANGLNVAALEALTETPPEFDERRNRFLNHLMARFGEQFSEYTLLLTNLQGREVAQHQLIEDKISFLKAYPLISHNRGRAFNATENPCAPNNTASLKKRINLLLGYPDLAFDWTVAPVAANQYTVTFRLQDRNARVRMEGNLAITSAIENDVESKAFRQIIGEMIKAEAYEMVAEGSGVRLELKDDMGNPLGQSKLFRTPAEARALKDELLGWSSFERTTIVEHLLLRPKFPGDALYPACSDGGCKTCGDEDPYSFRLTFVMPGWTAPFNTNIDMRDFAERTIRQETPSHLLGKICWVGNDGYVENPCDPVIIRLTVLLETKGLTADGVKPDQAAACNCAEAVYTAFSSVFESWYEDKTLEYFHSDALETALENEFSSRVNRAGISCTTVLDDALWTEIQTIMVQYFHQIALYGRQFERFEEAWCQWLEANAGFDWTSERLQERVEAILRSNVETVADTVKSPEDPLCRCAAEILTKCGMDFYGWMDAKFKAGKALSDPPDFTPAKVALSCPGFTFKDKTDVAIDELLKYRYGAYKEVSYRLWIVVSLLSKLRSTYPVATLHDCDAGSDQNPVRLGKTALGNL